MPGSAVSAIGCVQRESSRCPTPTGPTGASIRQAAHAVCSCLGWAMEPCSAIRTRTELVCTPQARQASEKGWERRSDAATKGKRKDCRDLKDPKGCWRGRSALAGRLCLRCCCRGTWQGALVGRLEPGCRTVTVKADCDWPLPSLASSLYLRFTTAATPTSPAAPLPATGTDARSRPGRRHR